MARDIPRDRALNDKDRQYLMDRGQYSLIAHIDQQHGTEPPDDSEFVTQEGPVPGPLRTTEMTDPSQGPGVRIVEPSDDDGDDAEPSPEYEQWSPEELKSELKRRGLKQAGTKQEQADRLYADDENA